MSVCIGLGSPMLMTFSLMMTILNKRWIRKKFGNTLSTSGARRNPEPGIVARARAALVIAEDAQQVPMRLIQREGWLARQIVLDVHTTWWKDAAKSLESTRRGVTLSLVAQLSVAVISWILAIVGSLTQNVGDTAEALALSAGSLWIWLVPVIIGWVLVGTQNKSDTISAAVGKTRSSRDVQCGIHVAGDFLADPSSVCVNATGPTNGTGNTDRTERRKKFWNVNVYGYQKQQGPAFNYARALTWINFADRLHDAFEKAIEVYHRPENQDLAGLPDEQGSHVRVSEASGLTPENCRPDNHSQRPPTPTSPTPPATSTDSLASQTVLLTTHDLREYPALEEVSSDARSAFWEHIAFSMLMGVFLQWGTTSLAFAMAHETVVKGLGCRSGAYLLYGILSTFGCFSMLLSAALSHFTMRGYELTPSRRGAPLVGAFAVMTLLLGRFLLVANTTWLLVMSIWELIGFFDSCYCASAEFSKGAEGWVLLFKVADDLKEDAQMPWGVCIGLGLAEVLLAILVFGGHKEPKRTT
ncbi:hypothetical protein CPLU01_12677 [Colletotrichum plurivorum]|uniref:Uncharacterized protein n=1 Tax=Colletotrichum plurivorum TaxID=2175906 RepID=A0A8H6N5Y6_9PEZI|nr:hypothetical protein CPLU01_12677 [Colletotrichum plurivorum]